MSNQSDSPASNFAPGGPSVASGDNPGLVPLAGPGGASAPTAGAIKALVAAVGTNPALVEFPADPWGFTRELRKAGLQAAGAVRGQEDKQLVLLGTLMILTAHVKARLKADAEAHAEHQAAVEKRFEDAAKYTRNYGEVKAES